jgi:Tripartite tricarboxylate transporter TctB family
MKLNAKDIASGVILILFAVVALWLNQDHALGTARRMGPGYMPMLVFWIVLGLGILVLIFGFFNGPDPLQRWTGLESGTLALGVGAGVVAYLVSHSIHPFFTSTYNDLGLGLLVGFLVITWSTRWRLIGYVCAALCIFCLLLERGGLLLSLTAAIIISALAEPEHRQRPLGVFGITIFLLALCWWVFIKQLDIRVSVWPQF